MCLLVLVAGLPGGCVVDTSLGDFRLRCGLDGSCPSGQSCLAGVCGAAGDGGALGDGGTSADGGGSPDGGSALDGGVGDGGTLADGGPVDGGSPLTADSISAGAYNTCAISGGALSCWGLAEWGQFASGSTYSSGHPTAVPLVGEALSVAVGGGHVCARIRDGGTIRLRCWGLNADGQLGDGSFNSRFSPVSILEGRAVSQVTAGGAHTCALADGLPFCWGSNDQGQLGANGTTRSATPVQVTAVTTPTALAAGNAFTCALVGGAVRCWGENASGELGVGSLDGGLPASNVLDVTGATALAVGASHACVIVGSGSGAAVRCWGLGSDGQLGAAGAPSAQPTPVSVVGLANVKAIAAGGAHTCAVRHDGVLLCWGDNRFGQLGTGDLTSRNVPAQSLIDDIVDVSAGAQHTCARTSAGVVWCWGANRDGQLGSRRRDRVTPAVVTGLTGVRSLALGERHSCALRGLADGGSAVTCWGSGEAGQLGSVSAPQDYDGLRYDPELVPSAHGPSSLSAGAGHTCVADSDGFISCWGANSEGQLGLGDTEPRDTPARVRGSTGAVRLGAGHFHACSSDTTNLSCWGANSAGQLGLDENTTPTATAPVRMGAASGDLVRLVGGGEHTCLLNRDGGVVSCWGDNSYGQLGSPPDGGVHTYHPTPVAGLEPAMELAAGFRHTCAITIDGGAVRCWGHGDASQLGNGRVDTTTLPVAVAGVQGATALALGGQHSCALIGDGGLVYCWGGNTTGQAGSGQPGPSSTVVTATQVPGLGGVTALAAGADHTCAALGDGGVVLCWGSDAAGQLGGPAPLFRSTPTAVPSLP